MSKALDATCSALGIVTCNGVIVPGVEILSEGNQASSGILFLDGDKKRYFPSSASDIKTTIEKLVSSLEDIEAVLTQVATTLTAIGAGMTGPTTSPPPTLATDVVTINTKVAEVTATRALLNTLKDALK